MARYGMVIDTRKCVGCMDCVVACKTENQVPEGIEPRLDRLRDDGARSRRSRLEIRVGALQPLRRAAVRDLLPDRRRATSHDVGRVVLVDDGASASAARRASPSCPYDARFVHPDGYADKCTFCIHRVRARARPGVRRRCARRTACTSATSTTRSPR